MPERISFDHYQTLTREDGSPIELGRGAMGITYKAFDTNLRVNVALKVINSKLLESSIAQQRFLREARAAAQLRHPNVASVFHLGTSDNAFYYAMEFVDGETLESFIRREGPVSPVMALRITLQVTRHHRTHRSLASNERFKRFAIDKFHSVVEGVVAGPEMENGSDIGMTQLRCRPRLAQEALLRDAALEQL